MALVFMFASTHSTGDKIGPLVRAQNYARKNSSPRGTCLKLPGRSAADPRGPLQEASELGRRLPAPATAPVLPRASPAAEANQRGLLSRS